ncbi:MAG: beta-galactosidase [Nevskia sp.]|nr:beta-galactosidase [Nevskia sp.]
MRFLLAALLALAGPSAAHAAPPAPDWAGYQAIVWQPGTAARDAGLKALGFTAGAVIADRTGTEPAGTERRVAPLAAAGLRWYLENTATDFYSPYHRWFADHPVTWRFDAIRLLHQAAPSDPAGFIRMPSLSDPVWLERVRRRLATQVRLYGPRRPLFYDLADEAGIADLAAFWDFDLSADSLAGFRLWLRTQYRDIAALNREWGTDFVTWKQVRPMLTDAALRQKDDNFAAWSDFKAWMDVAFSRAVRAGTAAVHAADPSALAGIEGTQTPGWGGYDYTQLAGAVDVMESYNGGHSIEIARAFNPTLVVLTTSFGQGAEEARNIWRALLLGSRGLIVWDEGGLVAPDGTPGPRGRFFAPLLRELHGAAAARLMAATPVTGPVAILVSPPSFRVNWLLERRADGIAWEKRDSETEGGHDTADRWALSRAVELLTGLGVRPLFVSPASLAGGALRRAGTRLLMLPQSIALSDAEAAAIRDFVAGGGAVLADGEAGLFDGHGRRRASPVLAGLPLLHPDVPATAPLEAMAALLRQAGIVPRFTLTRADGHLAPDVEVRAWRSGKATILALLASGAAETVSLTLQHPAELRDLRRGGAAVHADGLRVSLPADGPVLLEVTAGE